MDLLNPSISRYTFTKEHSRVTCGTDVAHSSSYADVNSLRHGVIITKKKLETGCLSGVFVLLPHARKLQLFLSTDTSDDRVEECNSVQGFSCVCQPPVLSSKLWPLSEKGKPAPALLGLIQQHQCL